MWVTTWPFVNRCTTQCPPKTRPKSTNCSLLTRDLVVKLISCSRAWRHLICCCLEGMHKELTYWRGRYRTLRRSRWKACTLSLKLKPYQVCLFLILLLRIKDISKYVLHLSVRIMWIRLKIRILFRLANYSFIHILKYKRDVGNFVTLDNLEHLKNHKI